MTVLLSAADYAKVQDGRESHRGIVINVGTGRPYRAFVVEPCGRVGCRCHAILVETAAARSQES